MILKLLQGWGWLALFCWTQVKLVRFVKFFKWIFKLTCLKKSNWKKYTTLTEESEFLNLMSHFGQWGWGGWGWRRWSAWSEWRREVWGGPSTAEMRPSWPKSTRCLTPSWRSRGRRSAAGLRSGPLSLYRTVFEWWCTPSCRGSWAEHPGVHVYHGHNLPAY